MIMAAEKEFAGTLLEVGLSAVVNAYHKLQSDQYMYRIKWRQ